MITALFDTLGRWCTTWPWHVLAICAVFTLGAAPLVLRLPVEADVRDSLPDDMAQAMERLDALFGTSELAFLLVETRDKTQADLVAFGQVLQQRLADSPLIQRVEFGYPAALLAVLGDLALDYAPLFVTPERLEAFDALLTPQGIQEQIHKTLLELSLAGSGVHDTLLLEDPLQLRTFAFARLMALRGAFRFNTLSPYFLSQDGTALLIKVAGRASVHDMAGVKATVGLLQQVTQELLALPAFQGLTLQATGGYFFAAESEHTIRRDMIVNINLSVLLIALLLTWAWRRWGVLLYAPLPTLLSLFLALGAFALLRPKLNALTLGCAASLIGLGIDYTIHILTHCFEALAGGKPKRTALQTAVRETGGGLLGASLTTCTAFAAFLWARQPFLQEAGLLAALGVGWCAVLCVTFLPALMACLPERRHAPAPRMLRLSVGMTHAPRRARLMLGLSLALSLASMVALLWWPPAFETDFRNIHAAHSPTLQAQTRLATIFGGSQEPLTLMVTGSTEEQVVHDLRRLEPTFAAMVTEGLLAAVTSPGMLYPDPTWQAEVLRRLRTKDAEALAATLATSLEAAGFDLAPLQSYIERVRRLVTQQTVLDLAALKALGFEELLQPFLAHDETGAVGLVVLFPTRELWTHAEREAISQRLTMALTQLGLQGTLTGFYTISSASAAQIGTDFLRITLVALVCVVLLVWVQFRRPAMMGMVLLPVGCGALWTAGVFAVYGFKLNFMNIGVLPMLLGIGVDYGIYIVHRFYMQGAQSVQGAMAVTSTAIALSALTTQIGFGTLALSTNQGIASVGVVSLVGITACLIASLCTLPAALQVWLTHQGK